MYALVFALASIFKFQAVYNGTDRWETAESENLTWEHCETFYLLKQNDSFMDYLAEHYRSKYWGKKNMIKWKSIINLMILQRVYLWEGWLSIKPKDLKNCFQNCKLVWIDE